MVVRQTILCEKVAVGSLARVASSRSNRVCWRGCLPRFTSLHLTPWICSDWLQGHHTACRADFAGWLGVPSCLTATLVVYITYTGLIGLYFVWLTCPQATPPNGSNIAR